MKLEGDLEVGKTSNCLIDHTLVHCEPHAVKHTWKVCVSKSKMGAVELMTFSLSAETGARHIHLSV